MTDWEDFFRDLTDSNNSGGFYNNYYRNQINPSGANNYYTFFGRLARQLADINKFLAQLITNKLPKSEILNEKVSLDEDGLSMDLLIERKEDDGTARKYKITVQEVKDDESDESDESDEETTDYFTP
jgi:hypothetical protein